MDKTRRKNILLGFFVVTGVVIFIVGIFLVGSKTELFKKTIIISAKFANATGLKSGSNVRFNGVKVGIVGAVKLLNDSVVEVDMRIEQGKQQYILTNAIASIASDGLMGDKMVNLVTGRGDGDVIKNNDVLQVRNPLVTDQVLQTLNATNENVRVISENLKNLTSKLGSGDGAIQALYNDPEMAKSLKQSFSNLNSVTNEVLVAGGNLQEITRQIESGKGLAGELINDTDLGQSLADVMDKLKETSNELNGVSSQLNVTVKNMNSGKGTVGMLVSDTTVSADIRQSIFNLKDASVKLDQNMEALKHNFLTRGYFRRQAKKNKDN